ncbi:DUF4377 domain-containing protein [uncultured Alistipes sp.]|jgi:hypothetical protein|uniref:DUF4377 domain-containing protein n=1 Tax=uncultured Alistipes sp. TaxID=538949 RepID=UPI0025EFB999|nr:DUF4377 domain-containing protein [uncultured Alistipes sp.]
MKKLSFILLLSTLVFCACDKDDNNYETREWTVASELGITTGQNIMGLQPVLLIKAGESTTWRPLHSGIIGFTYEPGYEYKLHIKAEQISNPPADGSSMRYTLLEEISKTPTHSIIPDSFFPVFTMEIAPTPIVYDQIYLGVRFPDAGLTDWQPWPWKIEGFEYEAGYTYRIRVSASVVPSPHSGEGYYTVQYSLLEMLDIQSE